MPIYIQDVERKRIGTSIAPLITPDQYPGTFPLDIWTIQQARYLQYWWQFTGAIWDEVIPDTYEEDGTPRLRYPLRINYLKTICMKHSYVLWGEVPDGPQPLAPVRCSPRNDEEDGNVDEDLKKTVKKCQNFINQVWMQNDGRALQQEGGLTQTYLGGYVMRLGWSPEDVDLQYKIRLENVLPDFFLPIWDNGHPGDLLEAWIAYRMPAREAAFRFPDMGIDIGASADPLYIEHWTKDTVDIWLNSKPLIYTVNDVTLNYENARNPFGFVPFEYIPRERSGGYYGLSLLDDLVNEVKELNARMADMGDAVFEVAHREVFFKNLNRTPGTIDYGGTRPGIDIGFAAPGQPGEPDAFPIDPPAISDGVSSYPETIRKQLQRDGFVPGVAEGEDEGSQRSALTLAFRMWPLTAKVRAVRTYWTVGLIRIAKKILKMGIIKKQIQVPMSVFDDIDWAVEWSPMIPRDREQELNEIVMSVQSNILSPQDALTLLNLVDDPVEGYKKVIEWLKLQANIQAQIKAAGGSSGGAGSVGSTPKPQTKVTAPVAETIMSEPKG